MIDRLIHGWVWVGGHRLLVFWAVALLCASLFSGGVALGAAREQTPVLRDPPSPALARRRTATVDALVIGTHGTSLIVRARTGERLLIRTDATTTYRLKNRTADATAVGRRSRVTILGRPAGPAAIKARIVVVHGEAGFIVQQHRETDPPR